MHSRSSLATRAILPLLLVLLAVRALHGDDDLARGRELARKLLVVDTHIDLPYRLTEAASRGEALDDVSRRTPGGDFDAVRAREGGLDAAWMSIYVPATYQKKGGAKAFADHLIDMVEAIARDHPQDFALATSADAVEAVARSGKIALPLGIENGAAIEDDIANLKHFFDRGVRYITLAHTEDNLICDSSFATGEHAWKGMSPFGRKVVAEMNRLGILVDVSHVSDQAFDQVLDASRAPAIASHSSCRRFTPGFERNLDDERIRRLAAAGGVIQINFGSAFLTPAANAWTVALRKIERERREKEGIVEGSPEEHAFRAKHMQEHPLPRASLDDVVAHIEHVIEIAGVEHVGLGSDFDGVGPTLPAGLEDVSKYPGLLARLLARGRSEAEIEKIAGGNLQRVWREAERVARAMQAGAPAGAAPDFAARRLDNWHQWRGPDASGVAPKGDPPLRWSESSGVRWKVEVPGEGHASPIVWEDRVIVLSAERTDRAVQTAAARKPDAKTEAPKSFYRFLVTALDRANGKTLWQRTVCEEAPHEGRQETNTYASASPITDGRRIFASFGSRGVFCLDWRGEVLWKRDLGDMHTRFGWGEGASPALLGETLVVDWDQEEDSFVVALDARTGETRWKASRDEPTSWATPLLVEHGGGVQAVLNGTKMARAYDLATGQVLWECGGQTVNAIPSPVAYGGFVVCMSGYRGAAAVAIPLDSRGDVTGTGKTLWSIDRGTPYVPSPIIYGERLYFTKSNEPVLTCVDVKTGKASINAARVPGLASLYASPAGAGGRVYFCDREGNTVVIRHGDTLEVLATNKLDEPLNASPAIAGRQMFLRGSKHVYCLEEAAGGG